LTGGEASSILSISFAEIFSRTLRARRDRIRAERAVIGLFEQWECSVEQIRLAPGDLLVMFSDGVTEAAHNEEEYGEARLIHELQACRDLHVNQIVQTILASVQEFGAGAQSDDSPW
jgi:phosphoserine phosphatase RsbU/P